MESRWAEFKNEAIALRKQGVSMIVIESRLGIARSTLSGWFKNITLHPEQQKALANNSLTGLAKARSVSIETKRLQKLERMRTAELEAKKVLAQVPNSLFVTELALAMLYWGEGSKSKSMSIGNSDAEVLKFYISSVFRCYGVPKTRIRIDLHLRMDQHEEEMRDYWMKVLDLPQSCFRCVVYDKRTANNPTHSYYKGVCQVYYGTIALQRRLFFLYTHYCNKVVSQDRTRSSVG